MISYEKFIGGFPAFHKKMIADYPKMRMGQLFMTYLSRKNPQTHGLIAFGSKLDCYYDDAVMHDTIDFVKNNWPHSDDQKINTNF